MEKSLRVLHVEDSERDAALLTRHLSRAGYTPVSERVETPAAMRAALEKQEWDLILCDYSLPHFNALQALDLLKNMELDLPFIIISGTVGEAVAVEAMRAGAHDYLMKDNLARLVPTIERELHEAENHRAQRRAEAALKASEGELQTLFEAMTDVIVVVDSEGRYLKVAPTKSANGYIPAVDRIGKKVHDVFPREIADLFLTTVHAVLAQGQIKRLEYCLPVDGQDIWFEASVSPLTEDTILVIARDVTERKHAEEEKAELIARIESKRRRLDNIIASVPGLVWEAWGEPDAATQRIDFVSDYVETMLGYSVKQWLSTPNFWLSIVHADDRDRVARVTAASFASLSNCTTEFRWLARDGRVVWVESKFVVVADEEGRPAGLRGVNIDITERKKLEEQLRQAQKMEAIGTLAGGIAHDFNNILAVIVGYCELAQMDIEAGSPAESHLEQVLQASARARDLVSQILTFSRREDLELHDLHLQGILDETLKLLRVSVPATIEIRQDIDTAAPSVLGDATQIQQVIMNLCVNAGQAMKERGGVLTVRLNCQDIESDFAGAHPDLKEGPHLSLQVSDTGCGMDQATMERIFEPFFTTKAPGEGTGLGLAVVHGVIKNHGGAITVHSELGVGTTFDIYLPVNDGRTDVVVQTAVSVPREIKGVAV